MVENHGGPGGLGDDGVEQRDQPLARIEQGEFHRHFFDLADLDARGAIVGQETPVLRVERAVLDQEAAGDAAGSGLDDVFGVERVDGVGRAGEFEILFARFGEHFAKLRGDLPGVVDDAEIVERAASALAFGVGAHELLHHAGGGVILIGKLLLKSLRAARHIAGDGLVGRDGEEELGLFLDDLRESFFDEAVEDFVNFLAGDVGAGGEFEGLEAGMADEDEVGPGLVGVQAHGLEALPEASKI